MVARKVAGVVSTAKKKAVLDTKNEVVDESYIFIFILIMFSKLPRGASEGLIHIDIYACSTRESTRSTFSYTDTCALKERVDEI